MRPRVPPLNYSRIYQFTPSGTDDEPALTAAPPGSNGDDAHRALFDALRVVFHTHPRRQFGFFDPALPSAVLAGGVRDYHSQTLDAENLGLQLAQYVKQQLHNNAQPHLWYLWYLWFIIEQNGDQRFIYLFLLKHDEGHHISMQQTVTCGGTIQPSHLQYAAKISLDEWQSAQSKTYLCYLTPKNQQPTTLAWNSFIGFAMGADRAAQTEEFLTVLERYADTLPPDKEHDYRARVTDYCLDQDRVGEPVEIGALSRHVDEAAPEALMNFLTERIEEPRLYADRKQLKRYTRLFGRDNDLSIGFSTLMLGRNIIYDESTETLTIRVIPKALKSQLARHVKKSE